MEEADGVGNSILEIVGKVGRLGLHAFRPRLVLGLGFGFGFGIIVTITLVLTRRLTGEQDMLAIVDVLQRESTGHNTLSGG